MRLNLESTPNAIYFRGIAILVPIIIFLVVILPIVDRHLGILAGTIVTGAFVVCMGLVAIFAGMIIDLKSDKERKSD